MLWVLIRIALASTHNICFYGELTKIIFQLSPDTLLICSSVPEMTHFPVSLMNRLCQVKFVVWEWISSVFLRILFSNHFYIVSKENFISSSVWTVFSNLKGKLTLTTIFYVCRACRSLSLLESILERHAIHMITRY